MESHARGGASWDILGCICLALDVGMWEGWGIGGVNGRDLNRPSSVYLCISTFPFPPLGHLHLYHSHPTVYGQCGGWVGEAGYTPPSLQRPPPSPHICQVVHTHAQRSLLGCRPCPYFAFPASKCPSQLSVSGSFHATSNMFIWFAIGGV